MKIKVIRKWQVDLATQGELYVDNVFECYTEEDALRTEKVDKETCIPAGTYKVTLTFSNRFQKLLPLINDVPNFTGVRIHTGNKVQQTDGCILVGQKRIGDSIANSLLAFDPLFDKMKDAVCRSEEITIEIINDSSLVPINTINV